MSGTTIPNIGVIPPAEDSRRKQLHTGTGNQAAARASYASSNSAQVGSAQITFEGINSAIVDQLNHTAGSGQQWATSVTRSSIAQPTNMPALPRPPRPPSASSSTLNDGVERDGSSTSHDLYNMRRPSSGPPVLPAINSGEELGWEEFDGNVQRDPFNDGQERAPLNSTPYSMAAGYSQPPPRQSSSFARPATVLTSGRTAIPGAPVRPKSNFSSYHLPSDYGASSYAYSQAASSQENIYAGNYGQEADAYASGNDSINIGQRQVRARSVTPMGNDEDMSFTDEKSLDYSETEYEPDEEIGKAGYGGYGYGYEPRHARFVNPQTGQVFEERTPGQEYPDTPVTTQHYGPAPVGRVMRRINEKKRRVQLTNGNLVIDLNVPTKLVLPLRREDEMMKTRYTAVTCDPDDFKKSSFFLRQNEYGRRTELFICITMYNEDEILFCRTLYGVMRNVSHLCTRKSSQTWGQDAWKKVVVCIVSDGRKKIHPRVLDCLTLLGVYQHGTFMKNMVNNKPVTSHVFEYTTSFGLDENLHFKYPDKGIVPMQILFCLKEKNQKKINSHRWFFNAFAPLLRPNVCVLIDVGTQPAHKSIYHLWKTFDRNSNVAGACGEIAAYKGRHWKSLLNPLVASQNFEYKISNILDKPTESLFGYISVLPGAFSAYRYIALQNNKLGVGPLASYFKGEVLHGRETDIFTSNMYLAEDRILCFELVAKEDSDWVLRYVRDAVGVTDVPEDLPEFISQRRRWLNGSFFASVYSIAHTAQVLRSGHSFSRKFWLIIEVIYNVINLVFSWFALGNYYLFFAIITSSLEDSAFNLNGIEYVNSIIQYIYISVVIAVFFFSMGNKPRAAPWKYKISAIIFAIINVYAIICAIICAIQAAKQGGAVYSTMLFSVIITYGSYIMASLLALDPWHMLTSFIPYILLSPTYINILNIYSYANLDDISWGTKADNDTHTDLGAVIQNSQSQVDLEIMTEPSDVNQMYDNTLSSLRERKPLPKVSVGVSETEKEQQAKDYYANVRTNVLLTWVLSNGVLLLAILSVGSPKDTFSSGNNPTKIYMTFILAFVGITSIIRFGGATLYMLAYILMG